MDEDEPVVVQPATLPPMPLKAIKRLLIEENNSRFNALTSSKNPDGMWMRDMLNTFRYEYNYKVESATTYGEINCILVDYLRLSLREWIESL